MQSDQLNQPNSLKWPKTSFSARFCMNYANIMQNMIITTTNSLRLFRNIKICNMKSSWCTKLKKTAKNQIEPQAPLLVVPFLIIFSLGTTQKCFLQALSPSLPTTYQYCLTKYTLWAKENSYISIEWSKTSFWAIFGHIFMNN